MFRFGTWSIRRPGSVFGLRRSGHAHEYEAHTRSARPQMGRGELTAFRRFRAEDAPDLLLWARHDDVLLESYNMELDTRHDAQQWLLNRLSWVDSQLYAVDSLSEGRVVGYICLREIDMRRRSSVLGISFDPKSVGCGYGTDALRTFLRYYFESWKYESMFLDVAGCNIRAKRCYEKCGYQQTGERWKPFSGQVHRAIKSPLVKQYPEMFKFSGLQFCVLFHDMCLTRTRWLQLQTPPQREEGM